MKKIYSVLSFMLLSTTYMCAAEGCLSGLFSINADKQVQFSQGNLQYTQSTGSWEFAARQYDYIGTDNVADGELADKIDLFGWSGSTATAQWGISVSDSYMDYSGDFVDWGKNAIINGGNTPDQWRTLTNEEWKYLLTDRLNAESLLGIAVVNGVNGFILLPNAWEQPEDITFTSGFPDNFTHQSYTLEEWTVMEQAGAVFLPAAGFRNGTELPSYAVGKYGNYSTATPVNDSFFPMSGCVYFYADSYRIGTGHGIYYGYSVRLVKDFVDLPSNTDNAVANVRVYTAGEILYVEGLAESESYTIYNLSGSKVYNGNSRQITLPLKGMYIVALPDGRIYKTIAGKM